MNRWVRAWGAVMVAALFAAGACGGQTQEQGDKFGGETNWLGDCSATGQCAAGECVCGICTERCVSDDGCGADAPAICVTPNGLLFQATCGHEEPVESGVCVATCEADSDCEVDMECVGGGCLRKYVSLPDETPHLGPLTYSAFVDAISWSWDPETELSLTGRCLPKPIPLDDSGSTPCKVIEAITAGGACDCSAPGLAPASALEAAYAAEPLELLGRCGRPDQPACEDVCLCAHTQATGDALSQCRNGLEDDFTGWCYVDPAQGAGAPVLVEICEATEKRLIRFRPSTSGATTLLVCAWTQDEAAPPASEAGDLGAPCIPLAEYRPDFGGAHESEVTVDRNSPMCGSGICLSHHFKGRVGCPYGNLNEGSVCETPDGQTVTAPVAAQLLDRAPEDSVICSCRCDGPDPEGDYCTCPSGFECRELIRPVGLESDGFAGSYCVKAGTGVDDPALLDQAECRVAPECG